MMAQAHPLFYLQWIAVLLPAIGYVCWSAVRPVLGGLAAATFGYALLSSVGTWLNPFRFDGFGPADLDTVKLFSADSALKLVLIVGAGLLAAQNRKLFASYGLHVCALFCAASSALVLIELVFLDASRCQAENSCGGLVGNPSMNACLMVVLLPIALKVFSGRWRWAVAGMVFACVLIAKASIPYGLLAVLALARLARGLSRGTILIALLAVPTLLFLGLVFVGEGELFNSGDRFLMWSFFLSKFNYPIHWVLGQGLGTFGFASWHLQHHFHVRENGWWFRGHNDILEALQTLGGIGAGLMAATYLRALRALHLEGLAHEASALLLFGVFMFFNYPLRDPFCAPVGCWLTILALSGAQQGGTDAG